MLEACRRHEIVTGLSDRLQSKSGHPDKALAKAGIFLPNPVEVFHVLGGNQSNSVSITRIAKSRLAPGGMRWPKGPELPAVQIVRLKPSGAPITTNEA